MSARRASWVSSVLVAGLVAACADEREPDALAMICEGAAGTSAERSAAADGDHEGVVALVTLGQVDGRAAATLCSAAVVGERHLLTAKHCFEGAASRLEAVVGVADLCAGGGRRHLLTVIHRDPERDLALVETGEPLAITPLPLVTAPIDRSDLDTLRLVGFGGLEGTLARGLRQRLPATFKDIIDRGYVVSTPLDAPACKGDSGGPLLVDLDGAPHVLGVATDVSLDVGEASCGELVLCPTLSKSQLPSLLPGAR